MKKARLVISMENSSFENEGAELSRIFARLAERAKEYDTVDTSDLDGWRIWDSNGNKIGYFKTYESK